MSALAQHPEALEDDCVRAEVVVTPWQAPEGCLAQVIDQDRLRREGALALRRSQAGAKYNFVVNAIRPQGVDRPWSPAVGDEKPAHITTRPKPVRPVDATPAAVDLQPGDCVIRRRSEPFRRRLVTNC